MCVSYLLLYKLPPKLGSLKQETFFISQFLRVRNLRAAYLGGSGSRFPIRLKSRFGLGLQSSESWNRRGRSAPKLTHCWQKASALHHMFLMMW